MYVCWHYDQSCLIDEVSSFLDPAIYNIVESQCREKLDVKDKPELYFQENRQA